MQRYFAKDKINNKFILDIGDIHHIKNVMRMNDNDLIEVVYNKKLYIACIENVKENIGINLKQELDLISSNLPEINIIIPFLKEQKLDFILQKSTELGVSKITLINLNRSIIKIKDNLDKKIIRWNKILKEASEQSKRIDVPIIEFVKEFDELNNIDGLKIVCSTNEINKNIKNIVKNEINCDKISVVIGPEGGITQLEEDKLKTYGFIPASLGSRIMRVETVPIFIMSILNYEYME